MQIIDHTKNGNGYQVWVLRNSGSEVTYIEPNKREAIERANALIMTCKDVIITDPKGTVIF